MSLKTIIMVFIGMICVILGAIGLFIPIWPTTPFFILSIGCFSSTPRLKGIMMKIPFFKDHLLNYQERTGLSRKSVFSSLFFLWAMILLSIILIHNSYMMISLFLIGSLVSIHIIYMSKPKRGLTYEE